MLRTVITAAVGLTLATGCAPDSTAPVKVSVLSRSSNGQYVPTQVELTTIEDVVGLKGTVGDLQGGARIVIDVNDPGLQNATEDTIADVLIKKSGHDVKASYISQKDEKTGEDVLWPADFHSWNMVTSYYNLERANEYFRTVANVKTVSFEPSPTLYYFPEFVQAQVSKEPARDNALFYPVLQSFLVLPFEKIQRAPLPLNAAVMAHEYSHLVFNRLAYAGQSLPQSLSTWGSQSPSQGANVLKAFDEGLADYHAYGATCRSPSGCDPRFMAPSFDGGAYSAVTDARDLSRGDRCMSALLYARVQQQDLGTFSADGAEYQVGTLLATALYQAGRSTGQEAQLQRDIVSAYYDTTPGKEGIFQLTQIVLGDQSRFSLAVPAASIIAHISDLELRKAVCNEFMDHLQIPRADLIGDNLCPASAAGGTTCPNIHQ
ncbi:hypothetical protein [Corallococcus carmarthensis]|uniref:Uncharacterized protein n=1 Tax=Corallococcus carmarthensis TaxID=2316728 RepID=A0A3A8K802_9BACT|nr:hypothetical protein [Corallococcus carmarthensis]NOK19247.1 hypothetical protein [Corallococcus carmarthensis]RKH04200.1 hypothetical protein D7X32_11675 [Corallococcus carmarthensis]